MFLLFLWNAANRLFFNPIGLKRNSNFAPIMKMSTIIFFVLLSLVGCKENTKWQNKYADSRLWYNDANEVGDREFDVFYLIPTTVLDRVDAGGDTLHHADPLNESDRALMDPSFVLAQEIFGSEANFYSPYYSQITLESWRNDSLVASRFPHAFDDVKQAFQYYMTYINNGRPFVLAGFSQGGKCVVELLKTLTADQNRQMVAAYVVGYRVTASDTLNYKQIKPALGETDTGVTISYNSMSDPAAACAALSPSAICINPINWKTTSQKAQLNDTVTVSVNNQHNVLIVEGFSPDSYYRPALDYLFKRGNYHLMELSFYRKNLSENVKRRFQAYRKKI